MLTVIVFPDRAKADELLSEIACTPEFENGEKPVDVYDWEEDKPCAYVESKDGRVAIIYPFGELTRAWLTAYLGGEAQVMEGLPGDWVYKKED